MGCFPSKARERSAATWKATGTISLRDSRLKVCSPRCVSVGVYLLDANMPAHCIFFGTGFILTAVVACLQELVACRHGFGSACVALHW